MALLLREQFRNHFTVAFISRTVACRGFNIHVVKRSSWGPGKSLKPIDEPKRAIAGYNYGEPFQAVVASPLKLLHHQYRVVMRANKDPALFPFVSFVDESRMGKTPRASSRGR